MRCRRNNKICCLSESGEVTITGLVLGRSKRATKILRKEGEMWHGRYLGGGLILCRELEWALKRSILLRGFLVPSFFYIFAYDNKNGLYVHVWVCYITELYHFGLFVLFFEWLPWWYDYTRQVGPNYIFYVYSYKSEGCFQCHCLLISFVSTVLEGYLGNDEKRGELLSWQGLHKEIGSK